jgi:hypothetical protein
VVSFSLYRKVRSYKTKAIRAELHCGREELCHQSDLGQAENPAGRILFHFMGKAEIFLMK